MTAEARSARARGRSEQPTNQLTSVEPVGPQYSYLPVEIGGSLEVIWSGDGKTKIMEHYTHTTTMMLRDVPGRSNRLGWWIPELDKELVFEVLTLSHIYRAEAIERADPAYRMLGDWLELQTNSAATATATNITAAKDPGAALLLNQEWQAIREQQAQAMRDGIVLFEAVVRAVAVTKIVEQKADASGDAIWIKSLSEERMLQLWTFLMAGLERIQDYFRQARRTLPGMAALSAG